VGPAVELLEREMSEAFHDMRQRLHDLADDEFFWEPISGSWTIFRTEDGRWDHHYEEPDPVPAPFTTIAWRLTHLAMCKVMYHEHAFGAAELTWDTIETPGTAAATIAELERGHALLVEDLAALGDADLGAPVSTNWGETWPAWRIFWTMIDHDSHHGGEIGVLRDLFRSRPIGGRADRR
jgi:hypothetical protein